MLEAEPLAFFKFRWRRHGSQIDGALNSAAIAAHHWLRDLPASVSPHLCGKFSARTSRQTRPDERSPGAQGPQYHPLLLRSEEHTSELKSLMRISYAVFCLKKTTHT